MKTHRFRFVRRGRSTRTRRIRGTQLRFLRLASLEGLEQRAMLSGESLLADSAFYSADDVHATPIHALSVANMLASCLAQQESQSTAASPYAADSDAPPVAPLAATSEGEENSDDPEVNPLVEGIAINVFMRIEDLSGNELTSVEVGQDFKLLVFVDDVRTSTPIQGPGGENLFGVFSAYVRTMYDTGLVSLNDPDSLEIGDFGGLFPVTDTSTAGSIAAGDSMQSLTPPGSDPQLLWSVTLHANAAGSASFNASFEDFADLLELPAEWTMYGDNDVLTADNASFESLQLEIEGPPSISIGDVTQAETDASQNFIFTVTLSDTTAQQVTVAYTTNAGTATAGEDFTATSGTLTFAPGVTQQLITVSVLGDTDIEADETFTVTLANPQNATIADGSGTGTIENDDTPFIGIAGVTQLEGDENNTMVFTVTISKASVDPVLVAFATQDGSATAGSDYTGTSGTLTFAGGSTSPQFITVTINGDIDPEANEAFQVVLTEPTNASFDESNGQATGALTNDDGPHISFVSNSVVQSEDQTAFVFTVTIDEAGDDPVTVVFTTADGTALAGSDYTATSGTLTFSGATTTQDITVVVNNDLLNETDETFAVNLSDAVNATFVETSATGTITNDDPLPTLSFESDNVSESEGTAIVFTVNLSAPSGQTVTVQYLTENGTASDGSDYTGISAQTLTFMPGETQQLITVTVLSDGLNEPDETFGLRLFGATNVSNTQDVVATGTIENDDPQPTLSISGPQNSNEGNGPGATQFVFTATLSAASGQDVVVTFATADGTATAGDDYTGTSGTLTFLAGETTKTITVSVVGDTVREASETFTIELTNPQNVTLPTEAVTGTITNDDEVPTLSIGNAPNQNEGDTGATPFLFTVTLSNASDETVMVAFATQNQSATTADDDYQATSGTLTFLAGETTKVITVLVNGDTRHEAFNESFAVNLSNPLGATIANGVGNAIIVDDDPQPSISISDATAAEGDSGTTPMVFTVSLSGTSVATIIVDFATQNGTATTANNDYITTSGMVTFTPGVTTQLVTVMVVGDDFVEPNETFSVVLSNPQSGTIADGTGTGTIQSEGTDTIVNTPSTVSGMVFVDTNQDGTHGGNEMLLAGTQVFLNGTSSGGGAVSLQVTTSALGTYSFGDLDPGTYTLSFVQPSTHFTGLTVAGSQGGTTDGNTIAFTIETPGGVVGTNNNFMTKGLLPQFISQRMFLASVLGAPETPEQVSVDATTVTNPINAANAASVAISGTGTAGAAISVVATDGTNSTSAQTTTVGGDGTWSISGINTTSLADGTITFNVTATGTGGGSATDSITSTKDTVAPTVAISTVTNPVNAANEDDTATSGTGTAGATISVVVTDGTNSTSAQTTTVSAGGTWSIGGIDTSSLADGTITYNVTATDAAGNAATTSMSVPKDTEAPAVAVGMVTPDPVNAANEDDVTITGTGTAGATISVVVSDADSSTSPFTTTVAGDGTWTITGIDTTSLDDGTLTFSVTATDGAGNTTTISTTAEKDTVTQVTIGEVTDPITEANAAAVVISGTGEVGAEVSVVAGDGTSETAPQTATVDGSGNWSVTIDVSALNDGTITFTATATDDAGNTDEETTTADKDTVAEVAITQLTDPITIANADSVSIGGTGEVGASISVVAGDGTTTLGPFTATVDAGGNWLIENIDASTLADGTITFTVTATDLVGNEGQTSDTAVKSTLVISPVTDPINADNQTAVMIGGTGQAGAEISVVAGDGVDETGPQTATVDGSGNWTVTIDVSALADGTITFTVTATDAEDNSVVETTTAQKDTLAPVVAIGAVTDPINAEDSDSVTVSGTGEVGAAISVVAGDGVDTTGAETTTVDGSGNWTVTIDVSALADGTITFTATATDAAQNSSDAMTTAEKDTVAAVTIDGVTDPINIANVAAVSIGGTGEVGATINVVVSDGVDSIGPFAAVVDGAGNWSIDNIDTSTLADGTLTFSVTTTDTAGNVGQTSTTAVKATLAIASVTDPINADNQTTVVISGTGEVGAEVSVVADDGVTSTSPQMITIDTEGNWSVTIDVSALADGTITFTVTATDASLNTIQKTITAEKDTEAPEVAITDVPDPINSTNETSVTVSGTGEVGAMISVVASDGVDTTDAQTTTVDGEGNWTVTIDVSTLFDGTITFTATATDAAGNSAEDTTTAHKDTVAPVSILGATDPVNADNQTATQIIGTGESGSTIEVVVSDGVNSTSAVSTTVVDNQWSFDDIDVSALADGTLTYTATITDTAGNVAQTSVTVTKDTAPPELTISGVTDPIDSENADSVSISGTGEVGAAITVVATDGVLSTIAFMVTVDAEGNWSINGIDVSALADGTITFTVTAADAAGNETVDQITADKTSAAPLAMTSDDDDEDEGLDALAAALAAGENDPDATDEALAGEGEWIYA